MEPSGLSVFKQLSGKMRWLTERQTVLARNVANVDTPGYRPRDLKPFEAERRLAAAQPGGVEATGHIKVSSTLAPRGTQLALAGQEAAISGNAVDLEMELKKTADTALEYQTMSHLYRKHMELLRMAVQNNGG